MVSECLYFCNISLPYLEESLLSTSTSLTLLYDMFETWPISLMKMYKYGYSDSSSGYMAILSHICDMLCVCVCICVLNINI